MTADDLIRLVDEAGIQRAAVLSVAYISGSPARAVDNRYEKVRAEHDWTSQQVAKYPDRLRGFCGVNPLADDAVREIARCARNPSLRAGSSCTSATRWSITTTRPTWRSCAACSRRPT